VSRSDIMTLAIGFVVQEGLLEVNAAVLVASLRKTYGKSIELVVCARLCFFVWRGWGMSGCGYTATHAAGRRNMRWRRPEEPRLT
jgi:hypothetical protein